MEKKENDIKQKLFTFFSSKSKIAKFDNPENEIIINCPKCEKDTNKNHGHLYISTDPNIPLFNCFKCPFSGTVVNLIKLYSGDIKDFYDDEYLENLDKLIHSATKSTQSFKYFDKHIDYIYSDPDIFYDEAFSHKRRYLQRRLGMDFDIAKIPNMVFDISNFIYKNKLQLDIDKNFMSYLSNNFIMFITKKGSKLVFRNVNETEDMKYFNKKLFSTYPYIDFYSIQTKYLNRAKENTIVLTEGIFDILNSINHEQLRFLHEKVNLWVAVLGSNYDKVIKSIIQHTKLIRSNFIILSDSDKNKEEYKKLQYHPMVNKLQIYYNKINDDFGNLELDVVNNSFSNRKYFKKGVN